MRRKEDEQVDSFTQIPPDPNEPTSHLLFARGRTLKPVGLNPRAGSMFIYMDIFDLRFVRCG